MATAYGLSANNPGQSHPLAPQVEGVWEAPTGPWKAIADACNTNQQKVGSCGGADYALANERGMDIIAAHSESSN